jgi:hypothetical protein
MAELMAVERGHSFEGELAPIMPHRLHPVEDLDELYPPLRAVDAVDDENEERDALLDEGVRIAHGIVQQASEFGRRRVQRQEFV